jgi:anti-sigma regulatory factor (Ser/Thr protein kinase)
MTPPAAPEMIHVTFPSDIEYIPAVRKFVADLALVAQHTPRFAFRTELLVDEICNNAVKHGSLQIEALITLTVCLYQDRIELLVNDPGGAQDDVQELRRIVDQLDSTHPEEPIPRGRGLAIVRTLANHLSVHTGNGLTEVKIVKFREEPKESQNEHLTLSSV